jgi:hypothetical protein
MRFPYPDGPERVDTDASNVLNACSGVKNHAPSFDPESSTPVHIVEKNRETFIHEPDLIECISSRQQTCRLGLVHFPLGHVVKVRHFPSRGKLFWEQGRKSGQFKNNVPVRGKLAAGRLDVSFRVDELRRHQTHIRMGFEESNHRFNCFWKEARVRTKEQDKIAPAFCECLVDTVRESEVDSVPYRLDPVMGMSAAEGFDFFPGAVL